MKQSSQNVSTTMHNYSKCVCCHGDKVMVNIVLLVVRFVSSFPMVAAEFLNACNFFAVEEV